MISLSVITDSILSINGVTRRGHVANLTNKGINFVFLYFTELSKSAIVDSLSVVEFSYVIIEYSIWKVIISWFQEKTTTTTINHQTYTANKANQRSSPLFPIKLHDVNVNAIE